MNDQGDAYKFVYPFGWQEVSVTGQVPARTDPFPDVPLLFWMDVGKIQLATRWQ